MSLPPAGAPGGEGSPIREARVASAVRRQGVPAIQNSFRDEGSERWTLGVRGGMSLGTARFAEKRPTLKKLRRGRSLLIDWGSC